MKLLEFGFKNIFAYGNKLQTIKIKPNTPNLVLLQGAKGQGKSSIKESILLGIYGKSLDHSLGRVPNRTNKNGYVYNKYVTNSGQLVETERGFAPNFLRLKIDGEDPKFSDANKTKMNQYIEEKLVEIPFSVFCNTVTISVSDFKSFVSLSPDDKRKIIDRIFGLSDVNAMNELNKAEIKALTEEIRMLEAGIDRNNDLLASTQAQLQKAQKEIDQNAVSQIEAYQEDIKELERQKEELKGQYAEVSATINELQKEINSLNEQITKTNSGISEIQKKLALYAKGKCPHCLSNLADDTHENIKGKLEKMFVDYREKLSDLQEKIDNIQDELYSHSKVQSEIKNGFYDFDSKIKVKNSQISEIRSKLNSSNETSQINTLIEQIETKIAEASKRRFEAKEELQTNLELAAAYSNDGMKSLLMAQIIPSINQRIQQRSAEIEYPFQFEFNDKFEVSVRQLGHDVEIEDLSTGEKKEMNLITLFCILDLMVMKSNLNFLFLDEIFTSLDRESIFRVISMLRNFVDHYKMTVFAISHDPLPEELFDSKMQIVKEKYWSDIIFQ